MILLLNVLLQFFAPGRRARTESDPERGPEIDLPEARVASDLATDTLPTDAPPRAHLVDEPDEESLPIDDHDDNDIIDQLEREQYPDRAPRKKRLFTTLSTFSTMSGASGISNWWTRTKRFLNPRTSAADMEAYVPHYRLMPIISGIIIPFSILLEIPGITADWYISIDENNNIVGTRPNTPILDIGLSFSIALAVLANLCLVVRFLEKKINGLTRKQRTLTISVMILLIYMSFGALIETFLIDLSYLNALYFTVVTIETIGFGDIVPKTAGARSFTAIYALFGILNLALTVGLTRESVLEGIEVGYRRRVRAMRARRKKLHWEHRVYTRWRAAIEFHLRRAGAPIWVKDTSEKHKHRYCPALTELFDKLWPWPTSDLMTDFRHKGKNQHPHGMHLNLEALSWTQLEAAAMEAGVPLRSLLPEGFSPKVKHGDAGTVERPNESGDIPTHRKPHAPPNVAGIPLTHVRLGRMVTMLGNFALAVDHSAFVKVPKPGDNLQVPENRDGNRDRRSVAEQYESLRASMEKEEKKAFYVRLIVVWIVFLLFWFVGSAIFMTTENWTYTTALYFCVIAFTTIGYGDLTPKSPAGRAVFIFWALLGVGTMTILISILSDAFSSQYKSIFTSGIIAKAVKRYQERARAGKYPITRPPDTGSGSSAPPSSSFPVSHTQIPSAGAVDHAKKHADTQLEALPQKFLKHARTFGEEAHYLIQPEALDINKEAVPRGLKQLMDDVAGVERLGERIKDEILRDSDARHALLAISIENALRKMVGIAEEAIEAMKERDRLAQLKPHDYSQKDSHGHPQLRHRASYW
ncbi:hypothetical protein H0H81_007979 [Sphagnurus paluster]|uniref:Potassium channel domain-containing protein n=1 Tax=Sphagnurus paluster TaxID=117069 RepID=A0A9P7GKE0_9AGAR|nr:hypothetical protein H0H81_007979 [Sphagnurus paluster]